MHERPFACWIIFVRIWLAYLFDIVLNALLSLSSYKVINQINT